ncbi:MAG: hypothetical protein AAF799_05405 [Myxococcota bacterium]
MHLRWPSLFCVLLLGCGPRSPTDGDGGGSGDGASADPSSETSADSTGEPAEACGFGDAELIGGAPLNALGFSAEGCNPRRDSGINGYRCCSDDPAAANGGLPDYASLALADGQLPYFSGANNDLSTSGQCIRVTDIVGPGLQEAEALDCPTPCNPTWDAASVETVCGPARQCCQTRELDPRDCVLDPDTGLFRPVTGHDVEALTSWSPANHLTHQDPNGIVCLQHANGDNADPAFLDCVRTLSVADQRGFCMALGPGALCPAAAPSYVDACEALNGE